MDRSLFESPDITADRLDKAASELVNSAWAAYCLEAGMRALHGGTSRQWLPRLTLVAAVSLQREGDVLPDYEQFLLWLDSVKKKDWHGELSERVKDADMLKQSGRLTQTPPAFEAEFTRTIAALGPPAAGLVTDIGCGGGLWAINLANMGYGVLGTERLELLVEAARRNALANKVTGVEFRVDDICSSTLPSGLCSRALCIGVTPTLPDDAAFEAMLHHLDRITKSESGLMPRRVILGSNRWRPSRMTAVRGILDTIRAEGVEARAVFVAAQRRLGLLEVCWWLHPRHVEQARARFRTVDVLAETHDAIDGTRVDLLLA